MRSLLCACALLVLPSLASGQEGGPLSQPTYDVVGGKENFQPESTRQFYFELNGGKTLPAIDRAAGLTGAPYRDIFGTRKMWVFGLEFDYELWTGFGTFSVGLAADYATVYGHGIYGPGALEGQQSPDTTSLKTLPLRVLAVYRFDLLARRYSIPLVPFVKLGFADTLWWITNGNGDVAQFQTTANGKTTNDGSALGGKWGYEVAGGLALNLNFIDPVLSREFDEEFGVNAVALHVQYVRISANNFGGKGLDLTTGTWLFGVGFEL